LEEISLPHEPFRIDAYAFAHTPMRAITLSNNPRTLPEGLFADCDQLASVEIGDRIEQISPLTFQNCKALEHIKLPNTLKHIAPNAFRGSNCQIERYTPSK